MLQRWLAAQKATDSGWLHLAAHRPITTHCPPSQAFGHPGPSAPGLSPPVAESIGWHKAHPALPERSLTTPADSLYAWEGSMPSPHLVLIFSGGWRIDCLHTCSCKHAHTRTQVHTSQLSMFICVETDRLSLFLHKESCA